MASKVKPDRKKSPLTVKCGCCNEKIKTEAEAISCTSCSAPYHKVCIDQPPDSNTWVCPICLSKKPKGDNSNTPVRGTLQSAPVEARGGDIDVNPALIKCIGDLLDSKLETKFVKLASDLRQSLNEDIKKAVSKEVDKKVEKLKEEFTCTTDFLADSQATLKLDIEAKNRTISDLDNKVLSLSTEVKTLTRRLSGFDRQARSLNVELQAVPEKQNENVETIFKKLCEIVRCNIMDSEIGTCRRVAKLNPKSNRPRNILVTLSSVRARDNILSAVHRYNKTNRTCPVSSNDLGIAGEKTRIYVNEHLSPETKELHAAARKTAKEKGYKFTWVKFGRVYMRKAEDCGVIVVKNLEVLEKL